ncbi:MAG TPA: hypothetical protein VK421_13370 [Pyrinomonadaceae bacterium]|nr:hypothetical protein [Pyrinomonadaceae bacterium]
MFKDLRRAVLGRLLAAASVLALAPLALAQTPAPTPQPQQTPQTQTEAARAGTTREAAGERTAATTAPAAAEAVKPAAPLYGEYRGVKLGMTAAEVRAKLGEPEEKSDAMDFYVFSETERARVYYTDGKASAVIATYIGRDARAPAPAAVLGEAVEAKADGTMYKMTPYPHAGYWVAYSRTAGDEPMTIITMQKSR